MSRNKSFPTRGITRRGALAAGAALATVRPGAVGLAAETPPEDQAIWFASPARRWVDALPVGNGHLGAMVFGGVGEERLALNADTLWSGQPQDGDNPAALALLAKVRAAVFAEDYVGADKLAKGMQGPFSHSFAPMADLRLVFDHGAEARDYRRTLDLDAATATVSYRLGDCRYRREVFASRPDGVVAIRLTADAPNALTFSVALETLLRGKATASGRRLVLRGKAPTVCEPAYRDVADPVRYSDTPGKGMAFTTQVEIIARGGGVTAVGDRLQVDKAEEVVILIAGATGFRDRRSDPDRPIAEVVEQAGRMLDAARDKPFEAVRTAHLEDHRALYRRAALRLGQAVADAPTDARVKANLQKPEPALAALYFNFGRYLLIASSRPGSQPANLQGIWNGDVRPPWSCNYTTNINIQMNYWHAEVCNLADLHVPLIDFIADLAERGRRTARVNYGLDGWCVHHNTDLWLLTSPVGGGTGDPTWANFALAGPWLAQHVWEHYRYGGDQAFLARRGYPLLKGCAEFCAGWLVRDPRNGAMTTAPSVSTENNFYTQARKRAEVSAGCTMDIAMIRELFANTCAAAKILGVDAGFAARLTRLSAQLPPYRIGAHGQLQEWEKDFAEPQPDQRHLSHLYPVYPGYEITPRARPDLAKAAAVALRRREDAGSGYTGWSAAWALGLWARLGDRERAERSIGRILGANIYPNLLGSNGGGDAPPFQIDGNFGGAAAIAELLLQSHDGELALLPTLPASWVQGAFTGLRARGGAIVDAAWTGGRLTHAAVTPRASGPLTLRLSDGARLSTLHADGRPIPFSTAGPRVEVRVKAGRRYAMVFA